MAALLSLAPRTPPPPITSTRRRTANTPPPDHPAPPNPWARRVFRRRRRVAHRVGSAMRLRARRPCSATSGSLTQQRYWRVQRAGARHGGSRFVVAGQPDRAVSIARCRPCRCERGVRLISCRLSASCHQRPLGLGQTQGRGCCAAASDRLGGLGGSLRSATNWPLTPWYAGAVCPAEGVTVADRCRRPLLAADEAAPVFASVPAYTVDRDTFVLSVRTHAPTRASRRPWVARAGGEGDRAAAFPSGKVGTHTRTPFPAHSRAYALGGRRGG
jgi:hypothetical protein